MTGFSKILSGRSMVNTSILFSKQSSLTTASINHMRQALVQSQYGGQFVRQSHGRAMFIRPGKFYTKKYFDIIHFWIIVTGLPFFAFIGYQNVFNGPAKLTDIPEDYEPKHWEYNKNPVKRFMSKYVYDAPERAYEVHLHNVYEESCRIKMRLLERKVKELMKERQDYKAWFYLPVPKEPLEYKKQFNREAVPGYSPRELGKSQ